MPSFASIVLAVVVGWFIGGSMVLDADKREARRGLLTIGGEAWLTTPVQPKEARP